MPWSVNTNSPMYQSMTPQQQAQVQSMAQSGNIPVSVQQLSASLGQTQASTQATQETAANIKQQIDIQKRQLQQQQFQSDTQNVFSAMVDKNGHVPAAIYNKQKQQASSLGMAADDFDRLYEHNYTDPTSMQYNTGTGFANQNAFGEIKRQIQSQIDQYKAIPSEQKGLFGKGNIADQNILQAMLNGAGSEKINELTQGKQNYLQQNAPQALGYEVSKAGLAAQLKGLIGGTGLRITQPELTNWQNLLPSAGDTPEVAQKKLSELDTSIKSTFNSTVGLDKEYLSKGNDAVSQGAGGNFLSSILQKAGEASNIQGEVLKDVLQSAPQNIMGDIKGAINLLPGVSTSQDLINGVTPMDNFNNLKQMLSQAKDIASNPDKANQAIKNNATNIVLGGLTGAIAAPETLAGETEGIGGEASEATAQAGTKIPGKLSQILNPQGTKNAGSAIREEAINTAQKSGATIPGDNIVKGVQQWADTAMKANPGEEAKIQATVNSVEKQYGGKQIAPKDAVNIYHEIDSGFSTRGIQKETIQASRDIALRNMFSNELEKVAPGWKQGTNAIAKGFQAEKGTPAKIFKNIPQSATKAGLNAVGLGILGHILGL